MAQPGPYKLELVGTGSDCACTAGDFWWFPSLGYVLLGNQG